ncbi:MULTISPECIES: toxin-antitoxin system, toxin component family protein [unclassified Streptomyces]|uniref:toxin-antitoxin system, toxin component family protein n=1 Tax=unclassified Streptomyces TaxID=2593676 RepID=UPI003800AE41
MGIAGGRRIAVRIGSALRRRPGPGAAMRGLAGDLATALRERPTAPAGVREVARALCETMGALHGGRPVELRFERFPDGFDVTGLCVEFEDFDLVIVEERAEAVQQLVILGHELWHLHAGHTSHHAAGTAAARALAGQPGWREVALAVAARNGSRAREEAEADDFGHRLAATFRPLLSGPPPAAAAEDTSVALDALRRTLGYRGPGGADHR